MQSPDGPTFDQAWQNGVQPLVENKIDEQEAYKRIAAPFRTFMRANVRERDLKLFEDLAPGARRGAQEKETPAVLAPAPEAGNDVELRILIPAFMISELRRGFEIGFLIVLPFLVIDLIVATLTMSMGMMMLPPTVISLPFKILFFVLIDGWNLLVGSLVRSFT
jgi:flagellar biosynthetic protein FliP